MKISANAICPCHSGKKYKKCCRPIHQGRAPSTPTALMRSRYSAYALEDVEYIIKTTHADSPHQQTDKGQWQAQILKFCIETRFVGLQILDESFAESSNEGYVTFKAILTQGDQDATYTERSLFKKQGDYWQYISEE